MTHDELVNFIDGGITFEYHNLAWRALKSVAELHEPWIYTNSRGQEILFCRGCWRGIEDGYAEYPCSTIQVLEKELE